VAKKKGRPSDALWDFCATPIAKVSAMSLSSYLYHAPKTRDAQVVLGMEAADDAAVLQRPNEQLVISSNQLSLMVDDPYLFGSIVVASALSNIYAMGAQPLWGMHLLTIAPNMPEKMVLKILQGATHKMQEARAVVAGGNTLEDVSLRYGMSVVGKITDKIYQKKSASLGDVLILTKPLGQSIVMKGVKAGIVKEFNRQKAIASMQLLHDHAMHYLNMYKITACTDVASFGLLVQLLEMLSPKMSIRLWVNELPLLPDAFRCARRKVCKSPLAEKNRAYFEQDGQLELLEKQLQEILFDPQISGGLLIASKPSLVRGLLDELSLHYPEASIIGQFEPMGSYPILFDLSASRTEKPNPLGMDVGKVPGFEYGQ
jgi:selenide, water dikinase